MITLTLGFILSICTIYGYPMHLVAAEQKPPILIHNKRVEALCGTKMKLHNYKPQPIDVTYVPQQIVTVNKNVTRLPISSNSYSTGTQHLKCVLKTETPQKKTDRTTLELLVRKEPLGKTMAQLLDKEILLKSQQAVVRVYQKAKDSCASKLCNWKPILTLPETANTQNILKSLKVSPEGRILLENS